MKGVRKPLVAAATRATRWPVASAELAGLVDIGWLSPGYANIASNSWVDTRVVVWDTCPVSWSALPIRLGAKGRVLRGRRTRSGRRQRPRAGGSAWRDLAVDIVLQCTGVYTEPADSKRHVEAGASTSSSPHRSRQATCPPSSTVSTAPPGEHHLVRQLHDQLHHTGDRDSRPPTRCSEGDHHHDPRVHGEPGARRPATNKDRRRGRAAAASLVPSTTGAAKATTRALPEYRGRLDGPVGSIADIVCLVARPTSADEVNRIFRAEARSDPRGESRRPDGPIVDLDAFIHSPGCPLAPLMGCS